MNMKYLNDQADNIERTRVLIAHLESQSSLDHAQLAGNCKELGDTCINLYRDRYAALDEVRDDLADESFKYYEKAIHHYQKAFEQQKDNQKRLDGMYAQFAFGNACKGRCLPKLKPELHNEYQARANEIFYDCVRHCSAAEDFFSQEYQFVLLLQANLWVRQQALKRNRKPKYITVFHSLRSPESNIYLSGVYHFAHTNGFEVWEYRFGRVRALGDIKSYVCERLNETSAIVLLASPEYSRQNAVISFEINKTIDIKRNSLDQMAVFVLDLGNPEVVQELKPFATAVILRDELNALFEKHYNTIEDLYSLRYHRCDNYINFLP